MPKSAASCLYQRDPCQTRESSRVDADKSCQALSVSSKALKACIFPRPWLDLGPAAPTELSSPLVGPRSVLSLVWKCPNAAGAQEVQVGSSLQPTPGTATCLHLGCLRAGARSNGVAGASADTDLAKNLSHLNLLERDFAGSSN